MSTTSDRDVSLAGEAAATAATSPDFLAAMERVDVAPLWDRFHKLAGLEPNAPDKGHQWRWTSLEPLLERAAREISVSNGGAERRVLMLLNPAFRGLVASTTGVYGAVQILMPGESARVHRHTAAALRFVIEGDGKAVTTVNGKPCPMHEGDLILTPNWTWHEHANHGDRRAIWLDGLDAPINYFYDAWFIEHGPMPPEKAPSLEALPDAVFRKGGFATGAELACPPYSPMFHYAYSDVHEMLAALPAESDGSRTLRYVNPATGGPVMPTMDVYMLDLPPGIETRPYRTTANTICVVAEGEGRSTLGAREVHWSKGDVFSLPHWTWIAHTSASPTARLFQSTDRALMKSLGYLRDEVG